MRNTRQFGIGCTRQRSDTKIEKHLDDWFIDGFFQAAFGLDDSRAFFPDAGVASSVPVPALILHRALSSNKLLRQSSTPFPNSE